MVETTPLSEQIENELRNEILGGGLAPGQRLSIEELATRWGTSSTPVRDAIKRLEAIGFLKVAPRRGIYVSNFDRRAFKDIFELRIALECLAIESATPLIPDSELQRVLDVYRTAERLLKETGDRSLLIQHDHLLHDLIIKYCDNAKLVEIMQDLHDLIIWARRTIVIRQPDSYDAALPEHLEIIAALQVRDIEAARAAMRAHLKRAFRDAYESWNDSEGQDG